MRAKQPRHAIKRQPRRSLTIHVIAKIPSNENILAEDAGKENVREKIEGKNVGVLKPQEPDNAIAKDTKEENTTGVELKEDAESEANEEVASAESEAFDITEDQ